MPCNLRYCLNHSSAISQLQTAVFICETTWVEHDTYCNQTTVIHINICALLIHLRNLYEHIVYVTRPICVSFLSQKL